MKQYIYECSNCSCLFEYSDHRVKNFECPYCHSKDCRIVSKTRLKEYRFIVPWEIEESSLYSLPNDKEIITS